MHWWSAWGQSATAIGGFVLGAARLGLGIYNACMAAKHGREEEDRAREQERERWERSNR